MLDQIRAWLGKHKETTVDKDKAMERLDAIEKEAKELRKIIDGKKIEYSMKKLYVGIKDGQPYILAGDSSNQYYRFHTFSGCSPTEEGWYFPQKTGQECIDYHLKDGFDIHVFDNTKEALQFFIDHL